MSQQSGKNKNDEMDFKKSYIPEDRALDARIKVFRRAGFDLQEIMSDPFLEETRTEISNMMAAQVSIKDKDSYQEKQNFIKSSLHKTGSNTKTEITNIKISKSDINELSAEWVREWHKKKQMQGSSPADQERKDFISASIKSQEIIHSDKFTESAEPIIIPQKKSRILRFTSLAAAAVLGIFITFRVLVPSGNTEKIFADFYKPYEDAVTLVTRGVTNETTSIYNKAVYDYKSGRYEEASIGFAQSASLNPSLGTPSYYIGLVSMERGDYDKAIDHFNVVISSSGNFVKESKWYLGLTYLKTGEKEKAAECFRQLVNTGGYFTKPSEKVLRRLK